MLTLAGIAAWGWPGMYVLSALFPAILIGGTVGHLMRAKQGIVTIRPGLVAIGAVMGFGGIVIAGAVFSAATSPERVEISVTDTFNHTPQAVWSMTGSAETIPRWNALITDTEPIGRETSKHVGDRYTVALNFDGRKMPSEIEILEWEDKGRITLSFQLNPKTEILELKETVSLKPQDNGKKTAVTYTVSYRVPSVLGRALNNFVVKPLFEQMASSSLAKLRETLDE